MKPGNVEKLESLVLIRMILNLQSIWYGCDSVARQIQNFHITTHGHVLKFDRETSIYTVECKHLDERNNFFENSLRNEFHPRY